MKAKTQTSISVTTGMVIVYVTLTQLSLPFAIIFFTFLTCIIALFHMVYTILKDSSNLSGRTFDDHFYEDVD